MNEYDVVIIGGGAAGLSAAREPANRSTDIAQGAQVMSDTVLNLIFGDWLRRRGVLS
jgi:flavin-dependent dehydrogenase